MTAASDHPLVTFAVIAYNQERYIREAIEGAFAQTYQPLEIILSDDCSPDRTFEIMQEMAAAYTGPHKVVLNRNEPNLRLVPHIDRVMELVCGEFIVVNAGDDISYPDRTSTLVDLWRESQGNCILAHSSAHLILEDGTIVEEVACSKTAQDDPSPWTFSAGGEWVLGATAAWDRALFSKFGPLGSGLSTEDHILPFRAATLGGVKFVRNPLIRYRINGISGGFQVRTARDFLYGNSLRGRKWQAEVDRHISKLNLEHDYPDKEAIRDFCRRRAHQLEFSVKLAETTCTQRTLLLPRSLYLCLLCRNVNPLKDWLRYTFEMAYIRYADWRISLKERASSEKG